MFSEEAAGLEILNGQRLGWTMDHRRWTITLGTTHNSRLTGEKYLPVACALQPLESEGAVGAEYQTRNWILELGTYSLYFSLT